MNVLNECKKQHSFKTEPRIRSAFTLVEVICAAAIFSLLFITALTIELNTIKLRKCNYQLYEYSVLAETIKNNFIGNTSYSELKSLYNSNKVYINKESLRSSELKASTIAEAASSTLTSNDLYVKLNISDGIVLKVDIELHADMVGKEKIFSTTIYKGNYQ